MELTRLMLDLCSGLGGASAAMRDRGWKVITIDNNPDFNPDIVADVTTWTWTGERPHLIWASPPCVEFSRESMPWSRTGNLPDMSIVEACKRIIEECQPTYWIIENVHGAINYFSPLMGPYRKSISPFFLWGFFPMIGNVDMSGYKKKESRPGTATAERAKIPYSLSLAVAIACEKQMELEL